ncbi:MAG TPA: right-handed parallel beta-helix repeat-containing protein [Candidatus Saccharimonadales bacterium]|jgi:hypothetical protein|nr:right-handed parallel beta-helix repeat-containing protein [Candidatus Saccharimonadales bacterium]
MQVPPLLLRLRAEKPRLAAIAVLAVCILIIALAFGRQIPVVKAAFIHRTTYYVSTRGDDSQTGKDTNKPLHSIQKALGRAQPGDTVLLADGDYHESITTVRSGFKGAPIILKGSRQAVLHGSNSHIVDIHHSYITLSGFHINGQVGPGAEKKDFRDKLVYAIGQSPGKGVEHLKIDNMLIENAGGECVRLRYFARHNEVSNSTIRNCGIYDFRLHDPGKNGEGIYIGTAPEQRKDGKNPDARPDQSRDNYIHNNTIETNGNECVDIKEAATNNLVEYNTCTKQSDPESGGFDARGNNNTFRYNQVFDTVGAAVRLGGDTAADGINNNVYGNTFHQNRRGDVMAHRLPQGKICNNTEDQVTSDASEGKSTGPTSVCE